MSSVPISAAYTSKLSKTVKSDAKVTVPHLVCDQMKILKDQNMAAGGTRTPAKHLRNGPHFWSDCKVSVVWEVKGVRVNVEKKA